MSTDLHLHAQRRRTTTSSGDLHTEHQILNMGPSHPATHGTVKFVIELDGETIVDLDIQVGYLHRGFEKECESGTWYQAIPYTDRLNYNSAILAQPRLLHGGREAARSSRRPSAASGCA